MTLNGLRLGLGLVAVVAVIGFAGAQEAKAQYTSVYVQSGCPGDYYGGGYYGGHYTRYHSRYAVHRVRHVRYVEPVVVYRPVPVTPCYRYARPAPRPGFGFHMSINHRDHHRDRDRHGHHRSHDRSRGRHR